MKKFLFAAILFIAANTIQAQTIDFAIDAVKPDSIYLIQKRTDQATAENPRPGTATTYTLFRSYEQISMFIENVRKQARVESDKAKEALDQAKKLEDAAEKISKAAFGEVVPHQQKKN